jgi:hypothetical protein
MFHFTVERLGFLKRIPGLPQVFDALLLLGTAVARPERLAAMEQVEAHGRLLEGIRLRPHRFGGTGFVGHHREIAHLHGNGLLDARVGFEERDRWVGSGRAQPHHWIPQSPWVSFWIRGRTDIPAAQELLDTAAKIAARQD